MRFILFLLPLAVLAGCTGSDPVQPGPHEVLAVADGNHGERFLPAERTISVGDTLTFRVVGRTPHTVDFGTSATAVVPGVSHAHSGNLAQDDTFAVTFTQPGSFEYFCQYHLPGMTGTVTVQ